MTKETRYALSDSFTIYKNSKGKFVGALRDSGVLVELRTNVLSKLIEIGSNSQFTYNSFISAFSDYDNNQIKSLFEVLCACKVIVPSGRGKNAQSNAKLDWEENGWLTAKLFHESVVYSTFLYGDKDGWKQQLEAMSNISQSGEVPQIVKTYKGAEIIKMLPPTLNEKVDFFEVLIGRKTVHSFNRKIPITIQLISDILHYSSKAKTVINTQYFGPVMRRTSPSGGSLHPVEIYPQIINVEGIKDGNYHYDPLTHSLSCLNENITKEFLYELSQRQVQLNDNIVAFIVSARFIRNFWKYRYAKSYAFTLFDVGHFVQTLILTCEAFGLKCFLTPALNVKLAQQHLMLDNIYDECPEYIVVAG